MFSEQYPLMRLTRGSRQLKNGQAREEETPKRQLGEGERIVRKKLKTRLILGT